MKVEKFIKDCTRTCSNELIAVEDRNGKKVVSYHEWITPDQALRAVEMAREEIKQQMMKRSMDAEIVNYEHLFTSVRVLEKEKAEAMIKKNFAIGERVRLIIIKAE